jgi:hypothetical protein
MSTRSLITGLFVLLAASFSGASSASASQVQKLTNQQMIVVGGVQAVDFGSHFELLIGAGGMIANGKVVGLDPNCQPYVDEYRMTAFSAGGMRLTAEQVEMAKSCSSGQASVLLDLKGSSFCTNQGGFEFYRAPKVLDIACQ